MPLVAKVGDQGRQLSFLTTDLSQRILPIPFSGSPSADGYVIQFGVDGMPLVPDVVLAQRNGHKLGVINNLYGLRFIFNLNSPHEISFSVDLYHDHHRCDLWDKIKDFKFVYIPSLELWFEIYVSNSDSNSQTKNVTGTSVCQTELGQINLYNTEINTEADILRDDYKVTTIFNSDPQASALNRILEKAPNYEILYVSPSIANLQRTFTFSDTTILDAFNEIAQEVNCIFIYGETNGDTVPRTISVYDLEDYCPVCGHREESMTVCPECENTILEKGYGNDTTIYVSTENLADEITFSVDTDSVKNCFHLEAGDDLMTATVMNCNPNGSAYIWNFPMETRSDMSTDLQDALDDYDDLYDYYQNSYQLQIDSSLIQKYNNLVSKYRSANKDLQPVTLPIVGYGDIINLYYDTIDFYGFLRNTYMPSPQFNDTTAEEQASYLNASNLSPTSVQDISYISLATANSSILAYAKVYVDTSRYQISITESSIDNITWTGRFQVKSYSNEEDVATTDLITVTFNDDFEIFVKQKIDKALAKGDQTEMGIVSLFHMNNSDFESALTLHCLSNLEIFYNACQSCIDILIENDIGNPDKWIDNDNNLYSNLYVPYTEKLDLISKEIQVRESELAVIQAPEMSGAATSEPSPGIQDVIESERNKIMESLDIEKNLGSELWNELICFRREDSYSNTNYISDGLSNAELISSAMQFLNTAQRELMKASTLQHTLSSTLKNLLVMKEFTPIVDMFSLGNWIRVKAGNDIFKLRLISYTLDFDSLGDLKVDFSDVIKATGTVSDIQSVLNQARSMATSYSSVMRQANKGLHANQTISSIAENGLSLTNIKIVSDASTQDVVYGSSGLLCRSYSDETGEYEPEQMKLIHKGLFFTNDAWKTAKAGLGEYVYRNPSTGEMQTGYGLIAETVVGSIILSESVGIYNESQSIMIDKTGFTITAKEGDSSLDELFIIQKENAAGEITKLFYVDSDGNANFDGIISASSGSTIGYWTIEDTAIYHTNQIFGSADGKYFGDEGISITDKFRVNSDGTLISSGGLSIANGKLSFDPDTGNLTIQGAVVTGTTIDMEYWQMNGNGFYYGNQAWGSANGQYLGKDGISIGNTFTVDETGNASFLSDVRIGSDGALLYNGTALTATGTFTSESSNGQFVSLQNGQIVGGEDASQQAEIALAGSTSITADNSITLSAPTISISGDLSIENGASGTFRTSDNKTVTVVDGVIVSIV